MTKPKYSLGNNLRWWWRQMRLTAPGLRWGLAGYVATTALTAGIGVILPAWLVQLLGNRAHYGRFVAVAISLSTVVAVSAALNYFCAMYGRNFSGNVRARVSIALHDAALNLDYARLQQPATERLFHQATTNGTSWTLAGAQAIYIGLARLLATGSRW